MSIITRMDFCYFLCTYSSGYSLCNFPQNYLDQVCRSLYQLDEREKKVLLSLQSEVSICSIYYKQISTIKVNFPLRIMFLSDLILKTLFITSIHSSVQLVINNFQGKCFQVSLYHIMTLIFFSEKSTKIGLLVLIKNIDLQGILQHLILYLCRIIYLITGSWFIFLTDLIYLPEDPEQPKQC